jgi:hypothetical protein
MYDIILLHLDGILTGHFKRFFSCGDSSFFARTDLHALAEKNALAHTSGSRQELP